MEVKYFFSSAISLLKSMLYVINFIFLLTIYIFIQLNNCCLPIIYSYIYLCFVSSNKYYIILFHNFIFNTAILASEEGDVELFITLVPNFYINIFLFVDWLGNFGDINWILMSWFSWLSAQTFQQLILICKLIGDVP